MSRRVTERIKAREAKLKPVEPKQPFEHIMERYDAQGPDEPAKKPKPKKSK